MITSIWMLLWLAGMITGGYGLVYQHPGAGALGWGIAGLALLASLWPGWQRIVPARIRFPRGLVWASAGVLLIGGQVLFIGAWRGGSAPVDGFLIRLIAGWGCSLAAAVLAWIQVRRPAASLEIPLNNTPWIILVPLLAGLGVWAGAFILKVSLLHTDGIRYFCLFDDAMIAMRYAWNFAHGQGLVWNLGERVEGYTSLLMVLVMSLGATVLSKSLAVLSSQVIGVLFVAATALVNVRLAREVLGPRLDEQRQAYVVAAMTATLLYYPLLYWSVLGMETGLLTLLATWATWSAVRAGREPRLQPGWAILLGLISITRPDAMLQAGLIFLYRTVLIIGKPGGWRSLAGEAAIWLAFPAAQLGFRLGYYGEWFPNTYYLKLTGVPKDIQQASGMGFIRPFVQSIWPLAGLALVGALQKPRWPRWLILVLFLSVVVYQVRVGGDPWLYWRIMTPYIPMLGLLAWSGADGFLAWLGRRLPAPRWLDGIQLRHSAALLTLLASLVVANAKFLPELYLRQAYDFQMYPNLVRIGLTLKEICKPAASVGVIWAGVIPYYSGLRAVDFLGKCDPHIAHLAPHLGGGFNGMQTVPGHNKYDLAYSIIQQQPDYVQEAYWCGDDQSAFVSQHYVKRRNLWLKKASPHIRWELVPE